MCLAVVAQYTGSVSCQSAFGSPLVVLINLSLTFLYTRKQCNVSSRFSRYIERVVYSVFNSVFCVLADSWCLHFGLARSFGFSRFRLWPFLLGFVFSDEISRSGLPGFCLVIPFGFDWFLWLGVLALLLLCHTQNSFSFDISRMLLHLNDLERSVWFWHEHCVLRFISISCAICFYRMW